LLLLLEGRRLSFHRAQFRGLTQQFGSQSFGIGVQLLVLQRVNEGAQLFLSLVQRAFVLLYFLLKLRDYLFFSVKHILKLRSARHFLSDELLSFPM